MKNLSTAFTRAAKRKEAVRAKLMELKQQLRDMPSQIETEGQRQHQFNLVLRKVTLLSRVDTGFISRLTILIR